MDNLLVGAVARHSLGRLSTTNDFQKDKSTGISAPARPQHAAMGIDSGE